MASKARADTPNVPPAKPSRRIPADSSGFPGRGKKRPVNDQEIWEDESWEGADFLPRVYVDGLRVSAKNAEAAEGASADVLREHELRCLLPSDQERLRSLIYMERAASAQRRLLHARIDFIRSSSDATQPLTANQLEYLTEKERALSDYRMTLHEEIDQLRQLAAS
jgi:hypothetical protein